MVSFLILSFSFETTFNAFLSGFLAIRLVDLPFRTLDELFLRPDYILCLPEGSLVESFIDADIARGKQFNIQLNSPRCPKMQNYYMDQMGGDSNYQCEGEKMAFFSANDDGFEKMFEKINNVSQIWQKLFIKFFFPENNCASCKKSAENILKLTPQP